MKTALEYLLSTYFHQDLYDVFGDEWGAVDCFIAEDPHRLESLPIEIDAVLERYRTEAALATFVEEAGCEFRPGPEDGGYRGWLASIAERVRAATT